MGTDRMIEIEGKKVSETTIIEALKKHCDFGKEEKKPEIRHGDYRAKSKMSIQLFLKGFDRKTIHLCQEGGLFEGSYDRWPTIKDPIHSGNIFDDLKALQTDLTDVTIEGADDYGSVHITLNDGVHITSFDIQPYELGKAKEYAKAILRVAATAERQQKDC